MKKLLLILAMASIFAVGCQSDNTTNTVGGNSRVSQLTISLPDTPDTKTALGEKAGNTYPVYWSEGDCIVVNGIKSKEAVINDTNPSNATFDLGAELNYPLSIVYPYTSTTTAESPKVVFQTEQEYTDGSFATESAPMCGYSATHTRTIQMEHLTSVLRIPMKASTEGVVLSNIVITAKNNIAGEFNVDCQNATISATENVSNVVTYSLPANFTLSTTAESVFHITLPAVEVGNSTVEFVEANGSKMVVNWNPSKPLSKGIVREFKQVTYKRGTTGLLEPFQSQECEFEIFYTTVYGYVKDSNGNPIEGVAVSDGFQVVSTDQNGYYSMDNVTKDTWYIYISVPSEYEIPINEYGQPCFYKKYPSSSPQFDFTLTPLAGGKEEKFALVTFADPQVANNTRLPRFLNEAVPGIRKHMDELSKEVPCYGITLGDIISNSGSNNCSDLRDDMRDGFAKDVIGLPVFQVMGNHDNTHYNKSNPLSADSRSSSFELKAQREHEAVFGPINYSFNRGDMHIVGMRNIVYTSNTSSGAYERGFLPSQYRWLQQDLALVPKDKMVVLCVHISMGAYNINYNKEVLALLNEYKEAHILSGHHHIQRNIEHSAEGTIYTNVYEHNTCAVCGAWWASNIAADGSPNGYNVFIGEGNTFSDWYYMGYHEKMNIRDHQMRLYRGNAITGAKITEPNTNGTKGYYAFNYGDDVLLANVYNADSKWTITVYENGKLSGTMEKITPSAPDVTSLIGSYTYEDPRRVADGISPSVDLYVAGLHMGLLGGSTGSGASWARCYHMYKYKLKDKTATIKVVARDRFGNEYEEDKITEGTDYTYVQYIQE